MRFGRSFSANADQDYYIDDGFDDEYDSEYDISERQMEDGDCLFDTYDNIVDDLSDNYVEDDFEGGLHGLDPEDLGLALALAEEISDMDRNKYDIDETTDMENIRRASKVSSDFSRNRLRPFEQHVANFCNPKNPFFRGR